MAIPFARCRISLAVDTSGSTAGSILRTELGFVRDVLGQLPQDSMENMLVLPWNDTAGHPCRVGNLDTLTSGGGTNPVVLLQSEAHLSALKLTKVWFLLTDGDITQAEVNTFASTLAAKRMHGVPVVIVIFDQLRNKPSECNISVGLSPFAAVPNSALLFQDVQHDGKCYVLATKGCFNAFLPTGVEQPVLDGDTSWSRLPTIEPESAFVGLEIPPALNLSPEELALSDSLTVNFDTLFNTDLDDRQVNELLGNRNHLQTLLLNAQAQGQSPSVRTWLQRQTAFSAVYPFSSQQRASVDLGGRAAQSMQRLTQVLQRTHLSDAGPRNNPDVGGIRDVENIRTELREAHRRNSQHLSRAQSNRNATIDQALASLTRTEQGGFRSASLSSSAMFQQAVPTRPLTPPPAGDGMDETDAFRGECSLCFETDAILSILFKRSATSPLTIIPSPPLSFPLAFASHPQNDVISSWMCCYECSIYLVNQKETPIREVATASLPLVSWARNSQIWRQSLNKSLGNHYNTASAPLLPVLFLAILSHALTHKAWTKPDGSEENIQRREALIWARDTILSQVKISGDDIRGTVGSWITEILLSPRRAEESLVWRYPMEGFVVMTCLARTYNDTTRYPIPQADITKAVWKKLLYTITSRYASTMSRATNQSNPTRVKRLLQDAIAATSRASWLAELSRLGFLSAGDLTALQSSALTEEIEWIEGVAGAGMAKWLRWCGELRSCMAGGVGCIWEIKGRWGAEVEDLVERMEVEGEVT